MGKQPCICIVYAVMGGGVRGIGNGGACELFQCANSISSSQTILAGPLNKSVSIDLLRCRVDGVPHFSALHNVED